MYETKNLIGGEWVKPSTNKTIAAMNPSNVSEQIGLIHLSDEKDMLHAGQAAKDALSKWRNMNPAQRGEILYKSATLLEQQLEEVARLGSLEMGKPITEMKGEVMRGVNLLKYYAAEGVRSIGSVIPASANNVLQYTKRIPLGVVGIITPWNFPVAIPIWKIAPALITGNTIIWKPAEIASLSATKVAEIFHEAGLPAGVLNLVIGKGRNVGQTLIEKVELDGISFTGSTGTGMAIASVAASRNIKYQTEMGGKNAAVILNDADLDLAVPTVLSGAYRSAGQKCTATSRIIVEEGILPQFQEKIKEELEALYFGSALDEKSYLGPVASKDQYNTVMEYVQLAEKDGEILAKTPAKVDVNQGHYISPIVVTGLEQDHRVIKEEIFGPVAAIIPAKDFDDAVSIANNTVYGLSAAVFTKDIQKGLRFLDECEAGMVRVNQETSGVEYQAPFGGLKMSSSHTREQGQAALDFYSQTKTCAVYYGYK